MKDILINASVAKTYNLCQYDPKFKYLCNDPNFWKLKCELEMIPQNYESKDNFIYMTWKQYYFSVFREHLKYIQVFSDQTYMGNIAISPNDTVREFLESGFYLIGKTSGTFGLIFKLNSTQELNSKLINIYLDKTLHKNWNQINQGKLIFITDGTDIKYENNSIVYFDPIRSQIPSNFKAESLQGKRKTMEDTYVTRSYTIHPFTLEIYGVFDGHGGAITALQLQYSLPDFLYQNLKTIDLTDINQVKTTIKNSFVQYDQDLFDRRIIVDGATAIVGIIIYDTTLTYDIYLANLGDSRGLVIQSNKIRLETIDHKPSDINEINRIKKSGGSVVYSDTYRVNNRLSLSRAFGDFEFKVQDRQYLGINSIISPEPDVYHIRIENPIGLKDKLYILLACDGVWDVISSSESINFVENPSKLAQRAFLKGSTDNITILVASFNLGGIDPPYKHCLIPLSQHPVKYHYVKKIGQEFAQPIYQICLSDNNCDYIIKYIDNKSTNSYQLVQRERLFQQMAYIYGLCPKVIDVIQCETSDHKQKVYGIIMEKMDGDLSHLFLNPLTSNSDLDSMWNQILNLIKKLGEIGIFHNDTKICNFLYKRIQNQIKVFISDFGLAQSFDQEISNLAEISYQGHVNIFMASLFNPSLCLINISSNPQLCQKIAQSYNLVITQLSLAPSYFNDSKLLSYL
jgi:serine/threonine protein phosphatase PrpC